MASSPLPRALLLASIAGCSASPPGVVRSEVAVVVLPEAAAASEEEPPVNKAPWKVGAFASLTGPERTFGLDTKDGITLGFEEVNALGGPKGRRVNVVFEDDQGSAEEAASKVEKLIGRDKVVALLGEVISARSKAGGEVANRLRVPLVVTAATHVDVTQVGPFVFRSCFDDGAQARAAARFMVRDSGKKRLGVLRMAGDDSSTTLARAFDAEVARLGGQVVVEEVFSRTDTDLTPSLRAIQKKKPELIYAPVYWDTMGLVAHQAPPLGLHGDQFMGGDGWYGEEIVGGSGAELEGAHFTDHWAPDAPWPLTRAFDEHFQARFHRPPSSLAAAAYDAARLVASALGRARDDSPDAVREALETTRDVTGAGGVITSMGADREPRKPVVIVRITGHALHYETTVSLTP